MSRVVAAAAGGLLDVLRSPLLVAGAVVVALATAAPFAVVVGDRLREALAHQPPIALGSGEIDADWWSEFRVHAEGLAATFTPAIIGFAAPLDALSGILDGTRRPIVLAMPIVAALVVWSWFWGVALTRFHDRTLAMRGVLAAGWSHWPRFIAVSLTAAAAQLVLYLTVHPLLFRVVYDGIVNDGTAQPTAFALRVVLYLIFGLVIVTVSLIADYSRAVDVVDRPARFGETWRAGWRFVRGHVSQVLTLYVIIGSLFVALLAVYGIVEIYGGASVGGWRGIAIGQAYIVGRLIIRLSFGASALRLLKAAGHPSR
jgi:hypothetical protein